MLSEVDECLIKLIVKLLVSSQVECLAVVMVIVAGAIIESVIDVLQSYTAQNPLSGYGVSESTNILAERSLLRSG